MRRIAALLTIVVVAAACTFAEPAAPTTMTAGLDTTPSPATEVVTDTVFVPCQEDVTESLDRYLEDLGLGRLTGAWRPGAGPLSGQFGYGLLATELETSCVSEYVVSTPSGEFANAVVTWDEDHVHALIGVFVERPGIERGERGIAVDLDHAPATRLHRVSDDVLWGEVSRWSVVSSLEPFVVFAGDDPMAVLAAWNRAKDDDEPREILRLSRVGSWGVGRDIPDYTLYADGRLITPGSGSGYPPTFSHGVASFTLTDAQVAEIEALALATGITDGETFEFPEQNVMDAATLGVSFRRKDVMYVAGLYNPAVEEATSARQALVDLESQLAALVNDLEPTVWSPESFVVKVARHGSFAESNTMHWPVSFDLADGAARLCTLLEGQDARSYIAGLNQIGDEYQDRFRTIFEYLGDTYSVQAISILPGSSVGNVDELAECRGRQLRSVDPMIAESFWNLRGISEYEIELSLLSCPFDTCDELVVTLDGSEGVSIPEWRVHRRVAGIEDLFTLATHEDLELEEFIVDGIVGIPIRMVVSYPVSGARLTVETKYFETAAGSLEIEHDRQTGISIAPTGFEEWMP